MEKRECKSFLSASSSPLCCEMTLFKEELDKPQPHEEGNQRDLQL